MGGLSTPLALFGAVLIAIFAASDVHAIETNGSEACAFNELTTLTGNRTCPEAPSFTLLNLSATCANPNCTDIVRALVQTNVSDCVLSDERFLYSGFIDPIVTQCNLTFDNATSWNASGSGSFDGSVGWNTSDYVPVDYNSSSDGGLGGSSSFFPNSQGTSLSVLAIIALVLGSVSGGGLIAIFFVWLRNYRRKRRALPNFAEPDEDEGADGKFGQGPLTPSTDDHFSMAHYSSGEDSNDAAPAPLARGNLDNNPAASDLTELTLPTTSSGIWDDEAVVAARVPKEKVKVEALISRGGFGEVYRGMYNGQAVAIKSLLPDRRKSIKQITAFLAEIRLCAFLEHPQIVQFVGVAWDSLADLCVLSEFMEGGDLRALLVQFEDVQHRPHGFDREKVKIAMHIAHAMTYLHSLHPIVLHRDLKSKNILLDKNLNAKLTDFGVSRERSDYTMTAGVGTSLWMAPEVMMGERYDQRADMFSFGIVLSELDTHALPYSQVKASDSGRRLPVLQLVSLGRLKVEFSADCPPELAALGDACVSLDPYERPTAAEAMFKLHRALKTMAASS
ncbi:Tkl protein kinase, partial [Globisporangium splendens]